MVRTASRTGFVLRLRAWLPLLCVWWWAAPWCSAAEPPPVPRATSLVVDQVGLLSDGERGALASRLDGVQRSGRAQVAVLVSAGLGGESLAPYALRVAEAWKLGSKDVDNGVLVLLVPSTGGVRVEVGYGLEGDLPDLLVAQLVAEYQRAPGGGGAAALNRLLDRVESALPPATVLPRPLARFVNSHAEWKTPIVLLVLSVFTLLPVLFTAVFSRLGASADPTSRAWPSVGVWLGALLSALLFAGVLGLAARVFWDSTSTGYRAAALVFPLPLLWGLLAGDEQRMGVLARLARTVGQLGLFAYIFLALSTVVGAAMVVEQQREVWAAPLLAALFAAGPLVFLNNGRVSAVLMKLVGAYMYFLVALAVAYFALDGVLRDPTPTAFNVAAVFAVLVLVGQVLDDRSNDRAPQAGEPTTQRARKGSWAWVFTAAALLFLLPFLLIALVHGLAGDSFSTHFAALMAGDSSFSEFVWWASGALGGSALLVGMGGRFGGGGAGR